MPKYVVIDHVHHADEGESGIYRLTYAEAVEVDDEQFLVNERDVVWDAGDPRWEGREADDIAAEQRSILSETLTKQAAEAEQAEAAAQAARTSLGGAGQEL